MNHRWTHFLLAAILASVMGLYGSEPAPQHAAIRRGWTPVTVPPAAEPQTLTEQSSQPSQTDPVEGGEVIVTLWRHDGQVRVLASPRGPMYHFLDADGSPIEAAMTLDQLYVHRPDLHDRVLRSLVSHTRLYGQTADPIDRPEPVMLMADVEVD